MPEHHLRVRRTARYSTLGESGPGVREVWIACHGYGQLAARFVRHFRPIEHARRLIVAPEALSRFYLENTLPHGPDARIGATWMTREDRESEIADYVEYLDALAATVAAPGGESRPRLVAFGFSQGVATVMRWLAMGQTRVDRCIAWCGSVPQDLDLAAGRARFGAEAVTVAFGDRDPYFDGARIAQQTDLLRAAGVPFEYVPFEGGHAIDPQTLIRIAGEPPA
ncbi:MAG: dienelactone hydrolase family protein [Gemmatimonadota bacterium]|nr:dienelactone hydrolase family protein [Gemmatimonadota bacterium]